MYSNSKKMYAIVDTCIQCLNSVMCIVLYTYIGMYAIGRSHQV